MTSNIHQHSPCHYLISPTTHCHSLSHNKVLGTEHTAKYEDIEKLYYATKVAEVSASPPKMFVLSCCGHCWDLRGLSHVTTANLLKARREQGRQAPSGPSKRLNIHPRLISPPPAAKIHFNCLNVYNKLEPLSRCSYVYPPLRLPHIALFFILFSSARCLKGRQRAASDLSTLGMAQ